MFTASIAPSSNAPSADLDDLKPLDALNLLADLKNKSPAHEYHFKQAPAIHTQPRTRSKARLFSWHRNNAWRATELAGANGNGVILSVAKDPERLRRNERRPSHTIVPFQTRCHPEGSEGSEKIAQKRTPALARNRPLRVLGLMSGTSADGIDVALVRISGAPPRLEAKLENFFSIPYPAKVRAAVLSLGEGAATSTAVKSANSIFFWENYSPPQR